MDSVDTESIFFGLKWLIMIKIEKVIIWEK